MKLLLLLVCIFSLNSFALDLDCYVTDEIQASRMYAVGEKESFNLLNIFSGDIETSLDGGMFKSPNLVGDNIILEITSECDNFVTLYFNQNEMTLIQKGKREIIVGILNYESDNLKSSINTPVKCIKI